MSSIERNLWKMQKEESFCQVCRSRSSQERKDTRRKEPWRKGTANKGTISVVYGEDPDGSNSGDDHSNESLYVITDANRAPSKRKKLYPSRCILITICQQER